jgi:hypothetical protein
MLIEGNIATCQIRFFKDDLALGLSRYHDREGLTMSATEEGDSLFLEYLNEHLLFRADGELLPATILTSGEEAERSAGSLQEIWWYVVSYQAAEPIAEVGISDRVLFDVFRDQRNIFKITDATTDREHSFYFATGDRNEQTLTLRR